MVKKKNKVLLVFVILLSILVLGLIGYICYDKGLILSKSEKKEENKIEEVKETDDWKDISLDDSRFYSIYTTLKGFTYDRSRGAGYKDFNSIELASLAFGTADVNEDDFTIISTNEQTGVIKASFDASIVMKEINEIFNKNIMINYNSIKDLNFYVIRSDYGLIPSENFVTGCGGAIDSYDETSNKLTIDFIEGCGGTSGPSAKITERKIVSAKEKKDTIIVEEKAIYYDVYTSNANEIGYTIYSDNTKNDYLDSITSTEEEVSNITISVDSYMDKASTITHVYKLNPKNNKYYFVQSTIL